MDVKRSARVWILGSLAISLALLLLGAGPRAAFASDGQRPPNARVDLTGPSNGDPDDPNTQAPTSDTATTGSEHGLARDPVARKDRVAMRGRSQLQVPALLFRLAAERFLFAYL